MRIGRYQERESGPERLGVVLGARGSQMVLDLQQAARARHGTAQAPLSPRWMH